MKYVWMAVTGIVVGMIARFIYPGAVQMSLIGSGLLGIAGSYAGGMVAGMFTKEKDMFSMKPTGIFMSIIGALVLIFVFRRLGIV